MRAEFRRLNDLYQGLLLGSLIGISLTLGAMALMNLFGKNNGN